MSDPQDLRRRLARLNRGRRPNTAPRPPASLARLELPAGEYVPTDSGDAYRIEAILPIDHVHGGGRLADLLAFDSDLVADVASQPGLRQANLSHLLFLDTETTGLAGGAGTLVFLVGVGTFVEGAFRLRQYFLRNPDEEAAMLLALQPDLEAAHGFVTFNGRAFDLPLLETRYVIGLRRRWALSSSPHLDLLPVSRRLWSRQLPDCTMATIERQVLGVLRTEEDVPGAMIPELYLDFLRTGETGGMSRVIYHNAIDVLSLVGLASQVLQRHREADPARLSSAEALGVGRWHQRAGRHEPAETALRAATTGGDPGIRLEALRRYAAYLKLAHRLDRAVEVWQEWHGLALEDPAPCIELSKYYEWRQASPAEASHWAQEALVSLSHWPPDWRREQAWEAVTHRLQRLARKMEMG
jgi:uncharacterized protein YprB with RNaseH-like and TPR domain